MKPRLTSNTDYVTLNTTLKLRIFPNLTHYPGRVPGISMQKICAE